ncbi:MAG: barstar family protein [Rhodanobacter sp.]
MLHPLDPDLTRPTQNGVYYVDVAAVERLAAAAAANELHVCRTDLANCTGKVDLLQRLATSLALPATFGHNWDALADCLRDLSWLPAWGHVLVLEHAAALRHVAPADFAVLLGVLDDAATFATDRYAPWFAFLALHDEPPATPTCST